MVKLVAQNLEMRFDNKLLFQCEHLSFDQEQVIYLAGDNGSGKTSLMKLLAGLLSPTQGKISAQGFAPIPWWKSSKLLGKALYLHQHPYLFDGSVQYNLTYALPNAQRAKQANRIEQSIEMAQLGHLLQENATHLSGGERQRLAIARAWLMQPRLLMLDEPTSNMDRESQTLVLAMIKELKQSGTGMLISSHHNCDLTRLCKQKWQINQRQIVTSDILPQQIDQPRAVNFNKPKIAIPTYQPQKESHYGRTS